MFVLIVFGFLFWGATILSAVLDKEFIIDSSDRITSKIKSKVDEYKEGIMNINSGKIISLFSHKTSTWPYFYIEDEVTAHSGLSEDINRAKSNGIKEQTRNFIAWYPVLS